MLVNTSADQAIDSIKNNLETAADDNYNTLTQPSQNAVHAAIDKGKSVIRKNHGADSKDNLPETVLTSSQKSCLGMSDMAAALQEVASGPSNQAALLTPTYPGMEDSSPDRLPSRRRSSSRGIKILYDVRDEEGPQDRFHDPALQQAIRDTKKCMLDLADVLGSSPLHADPDSAIQRFHREVRDAANFQCPSSRTVGFVGDSGVGTLHR